VANLISALADVMTGCLLALTRPSSSLLLLLVAWPQQRRCTKRGADCNTDCNALPHTLSILDSCLTHSALLVPGSAGSGVKITTLMLCVQNAPG